MRLLQFPNDCHIKNRESMARMCAAWNIEYEQTNDRERLNRFDYDILWLPMWWISPDEFPGVKILYGPHHSVFPEGAICGPRNEEWSSRCIYTTLSDWNYRVFQEFCPNPVIPYAPLPFGINSAIEDKSRYPKTMDCIIYFKRRDPEHLKYVMEYLNKKGITYGVFSYGSYKNDQYMESLKSVKFVIWIGTHESQGFGFQECLASNIPILVWDVTTMFDEYGAFEELRGQKQLLATTMTKWSRACGEKFTAKEEFPVALEKIQRSLTTYKPRDFILWENSDVRTMANILYQLGFLTGKQWL
jgi:hypothetical protein